MQGTSGTIVSKLEAFLRFAWVGPELVKFRPNRSAHGIIWVPEGSLAVFFLGAILRSGRPRGPGKAFKKVGGEAPHI